MPAPVVRKLLVTDIRCRTCGAGPGMPCLATALLHENGSHGERTAEHAELERAGWEWQEIDPRDAGEGRHERESRRRT